MVAIAVAIPLKCKISLGRMKAPLQADKQIGSFYVILNRQWQKDLF